MTAITAPTWSPPERFDEYRLVRLLGRGGMGQVYLAHDILLDRAVAVKFILSDEPSEASRRHFFVEARAIARLTHPNVVSVYRVGEVDQRPYLVSEYVPGRPLDKLELPLDGNQVRVIGISLARGLAAAHRRGVLHRDIKPANAILADDGEAKLLDFGVAKLLDAPRLPQPGAVEAPERTALDKTASYHESDVVIEFTGNIVGTPLYLAPELWRGAPATVRSDLYSFGALLYEIGSGWPPFSGLSMGELALAVREGPAQPLSTRAPHLDRKLAAVIERCLERDPERRFASADDVREALEQLVSRPPALALPPGNPYRGLLPFEAEHRGLFFGRQAEVRAVLDRLRSDPFVLIAGDSGVGKSSLVRAGVLPLLADGALGPAAEGTTLLLSPGAAPLDALAAAFAPLVDQEEAALVERLRADPPSLARRLRHAPAASARRVLLFVDQMEELLTLAPAADAAIASEALAALAGSFPQVRLIATVRSDFLARLSTLPRLGDGVTRALHLVRPLSSEGVREAIVGPATQAGLRFESDELVDELVASAGRAAGELPLLQFALAQLWEARDADGGLIRAAALRSMGGVAGALARYADGILGLLLPEHRTLARRLLTALVTPEGTRAHRTLADLAGDGSQAAAARVVLETLVRGRILTVEESGSAEAPTYQIAHDSLVEGWDTLRGWRAHEQERNAVRQRLRRAAEEWQRLGRPVDGLWTRRPLAEAAELDAAELGPVEAEFLRQSHRAAQRQRRWRRAVAIGIPLLLALGWGGARAVAVHNLGKAVRRHVDEAERVLMQVRGKEQEIEQLRAAAFLAFDQRKSDVGEETWDRVLQLGSEARAGWASAAQSLETALALDGSRVDTRQRFAALLADRAALAERDHRLGERDELARRMVAYDDDGAQRARWNAPARLTLMTTPPGASVTIQRYMDDAGRRVLSAPESLGATPLTDHEIAPGSWLLILDAPGHVAVRYPVVLGRGEAERVEVPLLPHVPDGYTYIPPGRFYFGSDDDETMRRTMLTAQPLHQTRTGGYFIGRHEVTFADWIAFLRTLPAEERARRLPHTQKGMKSTGDESFLELRETADGFRLTLQPRTQALTAAGGETIHYPERTIRADQRWLQLPVSGISWEDALAYAAWLDHSRRLRGAQPCDEHQWERAARGADDRLFPNGDRLRPDDANFDETYGRKTLAFGPDEVGSHGSSDSPFRVADLAGNTWEWVGSVSGQKEVVIRGGSWYHAELAARSNNREVVEPTLRAIETGLRICAAAPH